MQGRRSDGMRYRWFHKEEEDEFGMPKSRGQIVREQMEALEREKEAQKGRFNRAEITGIILASLLLAYSAVQGDIPALFFALSFLSMEFSPLAEKFCGKVVGNLLKSFAIGLLFGAAALLFW